MVDTTDTGPLDWRIAITDKTGRPTPEFQRRWNTQRNNNALIGTVSFGSGAPTGTPADGAQYVDVSTTPALFYIGHGNKWIKAGVRSFTDLSDAPTTYSGAGGSLVRVNAGATKLEFDTPSQVLDSFGSTQGNILFRSATGWTALAPGASTFVLTSGGAGANPTWAAGGGGGGSVTGYVGFPTVMSHGVAATSATGFFVGRMFIAPRAMTIDSIVLAIGTTSVSGACAPGIYGVVAGTYDIGTLLQGGPVVTGVTKGIQAFPLTTTLAVAKGQVMWIGVVVSGAALATQTTTTLGTVFFTNAGATPVTTPVSPGYDGTQSGGAVWVNTI